MALVVSGPYVGFSGTIDDTTYYQINGKTYAKKKNKKSAIPRTPKQDVTSDTCGMISRFMKPFDEFVRVGYMHVAKAKEINPHNAMTSHIWKKALDKTLETPKVDLKKLLVTQGNLPSAKQIAVEMTVDGPAFKWSTEVEPRRSHYSDQVILLAYFPGLQELRYKVGGAERREGKALLDLLGVEKGYAAEIFMAFMTNDRSELSDSIYLGQLNW